MKNLPTKKPASSIKEGDIYRLGDHLLLCGDARNPKLIHGFLNKDKINLILTDPPYGVAYVEGKKDFTQMKGDHRKIANDHIQSEYEYRNFTREWMEACKSNMATKNTFYIFNCDKMLFSLREGIRDCGYHFTQILIWAKSNAVIGRMDYLPQHELIAYGWLGKHAFLKSKDKSILVYPKPSKSRLHPTMKPIGLLRRLILNSSGIDDVIYDPFGGSGSTLIACQQTRRKCRMVEIDPLYCEVILRRFEDLTGIIPTKI